MESGIYAKLAEAAYSKDPIYKIGPYQMLPNFSNDRVKVYAGRNPGLGGDEVVFSIRGTKITDANDLVADVGVFHNKLKEDKTYQEVKHQLRRILAAKGIRVVVVGHSLGGSMAIELLTDPEFINQIEAVYAFNPGVGYKRFIADMKNKLLCRGLGLKFLRRCKELEIIRKKLKVFTTGRDPISLLSYASPGRITTVKPNSINTHGISNFTKLHPDTVENSLLEGEPEAPEEPIANMEAPPMIETQA
jgi:alpha-beta hydrolase superfamily lysophospholipase